MNTIRRLIVLIATTTARPATRPLGDHMFAQLTRRTRVAALITAAAAASLVATTTPAAAAHVVYDLPAGEACTDFPVRLVIGDDGKRTTRGNLTTGRAESAVVINLETGESVTVPSRGARTLITTNADGTTTYQFNGNLLLVLFSTDVGGAGLEPSSTTLIAGRTVFTVDKEGVFTVESVTGKTTDICEVLAP